MSIEEKYENNWRLCVKDVWRAKIFTFSTPQFCLHIIFDPGENLRLRDFVIFLIGISNRNIFASQVCPLAQ